MAQSTSHTEKVQNYPNAPVSEVIFGVTFSDKWLSTEDQFDARRALLEAYPRVEIRPPLTDERLDGFEPVQDLNLETTGVVLIRLRSNDGNWMCQIQANKFYFNWIRPDHVSVGNYPGYDEIYRKFNEAFIALSQLFPKINTVPVKYYELSYHDRLEWKEYIQSLSDAHKILRYRPPEIETPEGLNYAFSRYVFSYGSLGGHGVFAMNTATSATGKQVLQLESTLRGNIPDQSSVEWFNAAHQVQYDHFRRIFTPEVLEKWS